MIGPAYKSAAIQAVLGEGHSQVIPDVLHAGWLDSSLDLIAMAGVIVPHEAFGEDGDGVSNIALLDAGVCPATVPDYFALFDAETGGDIVAYAPVTFDDTPAEGDPIAFAAGALTFTYMEP